jgi:hypothetical protein
VTLRVLVSFALLVTASAITVGSPALEPARADEEGSRRGPVPSDVRTHLRGDYGITVPEATRGSPLITAEQALRTADEENASGGTAVSAHLVLYSDPDFGEAANEIVAAEDDAVFTPLYVDHLTWLVVIRDASPPVFGPPGRSGPGTYEATVAVFVDAETGADLGEVTLPPG